jgi:signal transduction histidine kinase/ActR/RegA family two-component response regulator
MFYSNLWNTITAGKVWKGELINKKKNGTFYDEEMTITPIFDDTHNITHFIAIKQDITERKKSERELREAKVKAEEMNKLKTSFLANMSHELRTPLVGILGFAELLRDNITDTEMSQMASRIYASGKRLLETLNSILDLSRIEANKLELKSDFINVCRVVRENIMQFEALAKSKNLYLKAEIPDEELISFLDDRILHQILNNLVNNALKFTKAGGVTIFVSKEKFSNNNYVSIKVKDTGIGIPEESLPKIFEEFRQVSEGLDRKFDGTGLGLTLTKKFVELLGGSITVESKLNEGSSFIIRFPLEEQNVDDSSKSNETELNNESAIIDQFNKSLNILLVENDEASIEVTKLFLKDKFNLDIVLDGENALKLINERKYDLILMDINLGKSMSGIEVTQKIKMLSDYKNVPIIAMTAYAMVGDKEEFFKAGCTHYLSKPFKKDQLIGIINDAISNL